MKSRVLCICFCICILFFYFDFNLKLSFYFLPSLSFYLLQNDAKGCNCIKTTDRREHPPLKAEGIRKDKERCILHLFTLRGPFQLQSSPFLP